MIDGDIEDSMPVISPLDVLAQVIVSMTAVQTWPVEKLYDALRCSLPFNTLPRQQFDLVLRHARGPVRGEPARASWSPWWRSTRWRAPCTRAAAPRGGSTPDGGTIPDRGYYNLRTADSGALLGELDEEFVWERSVGDSFVFGTQAWRIRRIGSQDVEVAPAEKGAGMSPFWKAEDVNRRPHLALRVADALERWNGRLSDASLPGELVKENHLEPGAADSLISFLKRQREATGADLPHRHHVLVEHVKDKLGGPEGSTVVVHTLWGGAVNKPYSLALRAAWQERFGWAPELFQDNDAMLLFLPEDVGARELLGLVTPENLDRLLRIGLEASGFFGARFRESAGRALLLPRTSGSRRMPLWLTRQRAKNLYEAAARYEDFPMLLEAWRTCLRDEFDLPALGRMLAEMASGETLVTECTTPAPSPFCSGVLWRETASLMYADDTPRASGGTALRGDLVRELALSADLRPQVDPGLAAELAGRLARTAEGWSPRGPVELLEWLKERIAIPAEDWDTLLAACERDHGTPRTELLDALGGKIVQRTFGLSGTDPAIAGVPVVVALESVPRIERALVAGGDDLGGVMAEWLRTSGPVEPERLAGVFGLGAETLDAVLRDLVEEEDVVVDRLLAGSAAIQVCDRQNLESLLRLARSRARPRLESVPIAKLPRFIASRAGPGAGR